MTRYQTSQHSACFGGFPKRWCFVARRILTSLVFIAALVQVVPVGLSSSRHASDSSPDSSLNESLSADTHAVDHWATQPTALTRVSGERSHEVEPLAGCSTPCLSTAVDPNFLQRWKARHDRGGHRHFLVTLVNLNVRLQV